MAEWDAQKNELVCAYLQWNSGEPIPDDPLVTDAPLKQVEAEVVDQFGMCVSFVCIVMLMNYQKLQDVYTTIHRHALGTLSRWQGMGTWPPRRFGLP